MSLTQTVENPIKRYEVKLDQNTIWQLKELAAAKKIGGAPNMVRFILKQYIDSELKTVKAAKAAIR